MVNGFAFLGCHEFVTHMTGTITHAGLEWHTVSLMGDYALIVASFVAGAAVSAVAIHLGSRRTRLSPWVIPLSLVVLVLTAVALLGCAGCFGPVSSSRETPAVFLLSLLAFAMGIQNAAIPTSSGPGIRTTHLSGHVTNLGVHLATACLSQGTKRRAAFHDMLTRGGKIVAFVLGAILAVPLTASCGFLTLLVPAACVLGAILLSQLTNVSMLRNASPPHKNTACDTAA